MIGFKGASRFVQWGLCDNSCITPILHISFKEFLKEIYFIRKNLDFTLDEIYSMPRAIRLEFCKIYEEERLKSE